MEAVVVVAAVALVVAAALATLAAWRAEARAAQEAAARVEAEERAQREAAARVEAEERAQREAADRARAQERAKREVAAREAAEERAKAEARARRDAERRAARNAADLAEQRVAVAQTVDEKTLVDALRSGSRSINPTRARRIENQLEALARLRVDAEQLRRGIEATKDEDVRGQLISKLAKVESDADGIVSRLRNVLENDPDFRAVKLSLAWGARTSPMAKKKAEEKK